MKKAKLGLNALLLIGVIYSVLGGGFVAAGIAALVASSDEAAGLIGIIFAGVGGLFLVLGLVFLAVELRKVRRANRLLENGRFLWGEVIECAPNYHVRINNRHPYVLVVRYMDARGTVHIFRSGNTRLYPDPSILNKPVKVYYEDESYKHYYVDVESIQPNFLEH